MAQEPEVKAQVIKELTGIVSTPAFEQYIKEIEAQPKATQLGFVQQTATIEEMKKRGIPVTEGFRIAVRTFENPAAPETFYDNQTINKAGKTDAAEVNAQEEAGYTVCVSLGFLVCASVGYDPKAEQSA